MPEQGEEVVVDSEASLRCSAGSVVGRSKNLTVVALWCWCAVDAYEVDDLAHPPAGF